MTDTSDADAVPTLLDRMLTAGLSEDRAREHIDRGVVRVAGEVVTDPDHPTRGRYVIGNA